MSKNTKIFIGIATVLIVAAVVISYFNPLKPAEGKNTGYANMHAKGYSMSGYYQRVQNIPIPDSTDFRIAVDTNFPFNQLKVGDPVIFRHRFAYLGKENLIHHLVHEISPNGKAFKAKGYYNSVDDGVWVEDTDYIGKVTHIWYKDEAIKLK